jgi:hypothetical protein
MKITFQYKILVAFLLIVCPYCPDLYGQETGNIGKGFCIEGMNIGVLSMMNRSVGRQDSPVSSNQKTSKELPTMRQKDTAWARQQMIYRKEETGRQSASKETYTGDMISELPWPDMKPEEYSLMQGRYIVLLDNMIKANLRISTRLFNQYQKVPTINNI